MGNWSPVKSPATTNRRRGQDDALLVVPRPRLVGEMTKEQVETLAGTAGGSSQRLRGEAPQRQLHARTQSLCFVCGQDNPAGMRVVFHHQRNGEMAAAWTPGSTWEGFSGIVHGGVVSTVLDEAMSKAVAAAGAEALTAELRIRYRRPVRSGTPFRIQGWVVRRTKRLIETEATITDQDGVEHAHAWGSFLTLAKVPA